MSSHLSSNEFLMIFVAMATFQQAAAVAMQSTAQVMQTSGLILDTVASS
jgi:hypothetical protein